jgi:hypothetical protein
MSEAETGEQADVVDQVIGLGQPQRVGRFRYFLNGRRWEWSDAVARIHGYPCLCVGGALTGAAQDPAPLADMDMDNCWYP